MSDITASTFVLSVNDLDASTKFYCEKLVSGFYQEVLKQSVEIWHKLEDKPWRMREFAVVTPDGHRIVFGEQIP